LGVESRNVEEVEVEVGTRASRVSRGVEAELAASLVDAVGRKTDVFEVAVAEKQMVDAVVEVDVCDFVDLREGEKLEEGLGARRCVAWLGALVSRRSERESTACEILTSDVIVKFRVTVKSIRKMYCES
jgi:hypothetical protein